MAQTLKDRMPPYNSEAELAVLGAILLNPSKLEDITSILSPEDFYAPANRIIFETMLSMASGAVASAIDLISLTEELKRLGKLEASGGYTYIVKLSDFVPTAENIEYYAQLVRDESFRRTVLNTASVMTKNAHDDQIDSNSLVEIAEQELFKLSSRQNANELVLINRVLVDVILDVQKRTQNRGASSGVPSGFTKLDELTNGFQKTDYIILAARPSIGKTACALTMMNYMETKAKKRVGFFSLEMSRMQIGMRLLSQEAKIDSKALRGGFLKNEDLGKMMDAGDRFSGKSDETSEDGKVPTIVIDDTPNISLHMLRSNARKMVKAYDIDILFIDYIGLITSDRLSHLQRFEQVAEFSRSLKALARELSIPIVVLAQVGRSAEGEEPKLSDLRDSGSIEQDADIVMFLHREREKNKKNDDDDSSNSANDDIIDTDLILAKHRNGPTGRVQLGFHTKYAQFVNITKKEF